MKKIYTFFLAVLLTASLFAQSPQKMSYQAVIRDVDNALVKSHAVGMRITILQDATPKYEETHATTTNANGLVTIEIGGGSIISGDFTTIDWSAGEYSIKTETDPTGGTNYTAIVGTSLLLSVPYALYAKTAEGISGTITASQVSDFQTSVTNNADVSLNTAKNSYPSSDQSKLAAITGTNTGDETTSTIKSKLGITTLSGSNTGDQTLSDLGGMVSNTAITGATKTKITYDTKGLVTAGTDATTADISTSTDKNYVTDAQLTVIGNTSGTNTGDNAVNTLYSGLVTNATHTGDATGSEALTLANVNSNIGTFNNITINAKGLATAGSNVSYLTLETDPTVKAINGIVKSNGTTISAATAGTDYLTPTGSAASLTGFPIFNQSTTGSAASFTGSLTGDITGTQGATVVSIVGTSTAANVHSAELLANSATNANTASTIVKRDGSGNFIAGTITAALIGNASTATTAGTVTTAAQPAITSVGTLTGLTVSGTTTVATPVNATDAANKAYVDALQSQINMLKNSSAAGGVVRDYDNNIYNVVEIGTQVWMAENLKTTKYNDGTAIPNVTDNTAWAGLTTGAYSDYNNTPSNSTTYGRLYNWYAVDNNVGTKAESNGGKNVCPTGWHVPSDAEWTTLTTYLGGESVAGGKLKETGTTHWITPNTGATNETGFTAFPSGYRYYDGTYLNFGYSGRWWSSTEYSTTYAYYRFMSYSTSSVSRNYFDKGLGVSVRCLRD